MIIKLTNKNGEFQIRLNKEDYNRIISEGYKIGLMNGCTKFPYARLYRLEGRKKVYLQLHRFITNCPDNMVVDHINHNTLDNRRCNLRIVTKRQNCSNSRVNKSGYVGVCFIKSWNVWKAYYNIGNKSYSLGFYKDKEFAIKARKQWEEENNHNPLPFR